MELFGFEKYFNSQNSKISSRPNKEQEPTSEQRTSSEKQKLTISQIQDLLLKDLMNDTVSDQETFHENETSIFEEATERPLSEEQKLKPAERAANQIVENIENTCVSSSEINESVIESPKVRPKRAAKKVLQSIKTQSLNDTENKMQSPLKFPGTRAYITKNRRKKVLQAIENTHSIDSLNSSPSKPKKNIRKKARVKNIENENVDRIAEKINNKFKKVEEYRLVIE